MKPARFDYSVAADAVDAVRQLTDVGDGAKLIAGGQSLGPMLNLRLARPDLLIDIRRCVDLKEVDDAADAVTYGAGIPHAAFEDGLVPDATPGWLAPVARGIAYRAVRNKGVIGGSVAHADPAADWPTVMMALGADALVRGADGVRTVPLSEFVTGPFRTALSFNEVLTGLRVPRRAAPARWGYWKFCRKAGEFAKASAAILHDPDRDEIRAVIGAIEQAPVLVPDAAELLDDPRAAAETVARLVPGLSPASGKMHAQALERAARLAARPQEIVA